MRDIEAGSLLWSRIPIVLFIARPSSLSFATFFFFIKMRTPVANGTLCFGITDVEFAFRTEKEPQETAIFHMLVLI